MQILHSYKSETLFSKHIINISFNRSEKVERSNIEIFSATQMQSFHDKQKKA